MMNPEHLRVVGRGKDAIAKWRRTHFGEHLDLSDADLSDAALHGANLSDADLSGAKLSNANLSDVDLSGANLIHANLIHANLSGADLSDADLSGANLKDAKLSDANLSDASLNGADLSGANLSGANLIHANLIHANLSGANLSQVNLSQANLYGANLYKAIVSKANLREALLSSTDLGGADLSGADLGGAKLTLSRLVQADLRNCDITAAKLYGAARDDWKIDGIKCDYVYWDVNGNQRSPKDRDLEPGEFERLYAQLPTIEYVFEQGLTPLDPFLMDRVVQAIRESAPEYDLQIDSINARGLWPTIKFTVRSEEHTKSAREEINRRYQEMILNLTAATAQRDALYQVVDGLMNRLTQPSITVTGPVGNLALPGASINIQQQSLTHIREIEEAIEQMPPETLPDQAKRAAVGVVRSALKDVADGQVKEAAKKLVGLGKDVGPAIATTSAYAFFKGLVG